MNHNEISGAVIDRHPASPEALSCEAAPSGTGTGYRALVLEGNALHRAVLARMLAFCGFACDTAESIPDALAASERWPRDPVLIDCDSPEIDGLGLASALRQREYDSYRRPVIALTVDTSQTARKKRRAVGFDNYIEKPFRLQALVSTLAPYGPALDGHPGPVFMTLDGGRVAELCQLAQDEPNFIRDIVSLFVATVQRLLDQMRRAEEEGDAERLERVALLLKTISGQMGVVRLRDTCATIQTLARSRALAGVGALLGEAALAFERAGCDLRSMEVDFLARRQGANEPGHSLAAGPPNILVAEGDPLLARFLQKSLGAAGFLVTLVAAGRAALSRLRDGGFDAAILDAGLPEVDGYSLLSAVRAESGLARLPVMILSPRNLEQDVLRAFELGADDYAAKPFNLLEVVARIRALLRRR